MRTKVVETEMREPAEKELEKVTTETAMKEERLRK